jgi:RNA polymerase sigma-70 factor (ECF subfamily)
MTGLKQNAGEGAGPGLAGRNSSGGNLAVDLDRLFEDAWHAHARRLWLTAWRITRNQEDAEDALQETFLKAFAHFGDFDGRSSLSTWLTRIAVNTSLMILRRRRNRTALSIDDERDGWGEPLSASLAGGDCSPEEDAVARERERDLRHHLGRLPAQFAVPLRMHALDGHSIEETAQATGLSLSATKSRIYRARGALCVTLGAKMRTPARVLRA